MECASRLPIRSASARTESSKRVSPQLVPGTRAGPGGPAGFATLKTLLITPELKAAGINVFGRPSGKASIVLRVKVSDPGERPKMALLLPDFH